jgi:hypothetical protein
MAIRWKVNSSHIGTTESQIGIERSVKMGFVTLMQVIFLQHTVEGATTYS